MRKIWFAVLILAALTLSACSGVGNGGGSDVATTLATVPAAFAGQTNPLGADAATAGAEIFKNNCVACHGKQGHGDGPAGASLNPQPKDLPELASAVGDDYLYWRINTGKAGTSMVGWKGILTEEQIWQVVVFIRTLK
jgi:mono/diheme cytochrome c family protein